MIPKINKSMLHGAIVVALAGTMSACGGSGSNNSTPPPPPPEPVEVSYEVTVTNLTSGQPFSPVAVILHQEEQVWEVGQPASQQLEIMAEGGDNSELLSLDFVAQMTSGTGPIAPGQSETYEISIEDITDANITVATMLVNTNDGFTGLNNWNLAALEVGDSWSTMAPAYDAGTEANSEAAGTIPGPADGGTGFDEVRDDVDFISMHPGVVSSSDNLTTSVLTANHKFDNPVVKIKITRMQ